MGVLVTFDGFPGDICWA